MKASKSSPKPKTKKLAGAGSFFGATKKTKGKKSSTSKTKSG